MTKKHLTVYDYYTRSTTYSYTKLKYLMINFMPGQKASKSEKHSLLKNLDMAFIDLFVLVCVCMHIATANE